MVCCADANCCDQAFRELTDEEILELDFDPDFDRFLVELQQQVRDVRAARWWHWFCSCDSLHSIA